MTITINATAIGVAVAILTALTRLVPLTKAYWERLPAKWRPWPPAALVVFGATLAIFQQPTAWLSQVELALPALLALLAPGALPVGAQHGPVAALLVVLGLGSLTGCAGSLEESRSQVRLEQVGPVRLAAEQRPPRCAGIDSARRTWLGVEYVGLGVAAGSAAGSAIALAVQDRSEKSQRDWALALGITGTVGAIAGGLGRIESEDLAQQWAKECSQ